MAAGPVSTTTTTTDRPSIPTTTTTVPLQPPPPMLVSDSFAKDAILAWFRGEFAAANAIIDALCSHLSHLSSSADYTNVFAAIHRRRLHWIQILQMQKYHSIADVALQLRLVAENNKTVIEQQDVIENDVVVEEPEEEQQKTEEKLINGGDEHEEYDSPESEITDSGKLIITTCLQFTLIILLIQFHLHSIIHPLFFYHQNLIFISCCILEYFSTNCFFWVEETLGNGRVFFYFFIYLREKLKYSFILLFFFTKE
jgi:hypothetical protein